MKIINQIKSIPILSILIILIILNIDNRKEYTKLKILIWNTPKLSLGTYLFISTGTGFILSYIFTNRLAKIYYTKPNSEIKYKFENQNEETNIYQETKGEVSYDNTLIERDLKDPSPTVNASFRIIGKNNTNHENFNDNYHYDHETSNLDDESDNQYYKQKNNYKNDNEFKSTLNDWDDDTYVNW